MLLLKPERTMWKEFCDGMTKQLAGRTIEIEVASRRLGVQTAAHWKRLVRFEYDRSRNTLGIVVEGLNDLVVQPQELYAEFGSRGLETIGILDSEAAWAIVWWRDPPMLPPPASTSRY